MAPGRRTPDRRSWAALCAAWSCWLCAGVALAGPTPQPEDVLPESAIDVDDPIGVDADSRSLDGVRDAQKPAPAAGAADAARQRFGPEPPPAGVRAGEVLTAAPATRESSHHVAVELAPGFARIQVELAFEARTEKPSELRYRLAVPQGSRLAALEVCNDAGCRSGIGAGSEPSLRAYTAALLARPAAARARALPIARGIDLQDARGEAILVRAAPLTKAQPLRIKLSYLAPVALKGGVLRLLLPARGMDPQVAAAEVRLTAPGLLDPRIGGAPAGDQLASVDPWAELELTARVPSAAPVRASAFELACGAGQRCGFAQIWAGPRGSDPVDLVIALDVSPSTEGVARGRLVPVIAALLASLPEGSRVRALAFAGRAAALVEQPMEPSRVQLAPFASAIASAELGSATRFEAVWELAGPWLSKRQRGLRPLIAIVGDGGLTIGPGRAFERARAAGIEVSAINAADRATTEALRSRVLRTSGIALEVGADADASARARNPALLEERMRALLAPTLFRSVSVLHGGVRSELGPLRAGEQLSWHGPLRGGGLRLQYGGRTTPGKAPARELAAGIAGLALARTSTAPGHALVAIDARDLPQAQQGWPEQPAKGPCDRRGPARRYSGLSSDALPVALAEEAVCRAAKPPASDSAQPGRGMPADPLLSMLRQRILPVARGCFRRDRAGRADYQRRAVFAFTLADREIVDAQVEGKIPPGLQECLLAAVDTLEVPRFTGTVKVTYPLVTESVPLPEQIQLQAGTAGTIDSLFGSDQAAK